MARAASAALLLIAVAASAQQNWPASKEANWIAKDFTFHSGETMDLRVHYTTVGDPSGMPVLMLHGTTGSGIGLLIPAFAGQLFGPGQALKTRA